MAATFASGVVFGQSLLLSGVYHPSIIVDQMALTNFYMMQAFLAASASSVLVIRAAHALNYYPITRAAPRTWLTRYDLNLAGGVLLGAGMAMTGACPGTVLIQVATGIKSGKFVLAGGIVGGMLYAALKPPPPPPPQPPSHSALRPLKATSEVSIATMTVVYEAACVAMVAASTALGLTETSWTMPVAGGLLIGLSQAMSILLRKSTLGTSSAFEQIGQWVKYALGSRKNPAPDAMSILFALGIMSGAAIPPPFDFKLPTRFVAVSPLTAFLGGVLMIYGARLAGGCTSGHGISGMAKFSPGSFVAVAGMFGGGILTKLLVL